MDEKLSHHKILALLKNNYIGRVACSDEGKPYVVPITYFFDESNNSIIGQTGEGMKVNIWRKNPLVCFELDVIRDIDDWETLVAWGVYQELKGADAKFALHNLVKKLRELLKESHPHVKFLSEMSHSHATEAKPIIYRINLTEIHGRGQKRQ